MQPAKKLAPRILLNMAAMLCFKGLRDTPLLSTVGLLVELGNIISAVIEDERELTLAPIVDSYWP